MIGMRRLAAATVAAGLAAAVPVPASAQDGQALSIELNNARDANGGCRLTYIAVNGTGTALDKTSYEIVVFDADQKVAQFLILEFGRLPAGKTKVVEFDFPNRGCSAISRILVNEVSECTADGKAVELCFDRLKTTSRTEIGFDQ